MDLIRQVWRVMNARPPRSQVEPDLSGFAGKPPVLVATVWPGFIEQSHLSLIVIPAKAGIALQPCSKAIMFGDGLLIRNPCVRRAWFQVRFRPSPE
jgi:hypothetical protein